MNNILQIIVLILLVLLEIKIINLLSLKLYNKDTKLFNIYVTEIINIIIQILFITLLVYKYLEIMLVPKNVIINICILVNIISLIIWYFFKKKQNIIINLPKNLPSLRSEAFPELKIKTRVIIKIYFII